MANNVTAKDASEVTQTFKTTDNGGVHTPHVEVDVAPASVTGPLDAIEVATEALAALISSGKLLVDDADTQTALGSILSALSSVAVTGPLTDTQLRATAVPVSGPLTDTQLRAEAVPITSSTLATSAKQDTLQSAVGATDDAASTGSNNGSLIALLKQLRSLLNSSVTTLASGVSNPSVGFLGAFGMLWNGSTWDRSPGGATGAWAILRDGAGNARGANVNSSNELLVTDAGVGTSSDSAATAGGTGTLSSKLRLATTQLASLITLFTKPLDGDYENVAASQTGQVLGATGASGDFLSHIVVFPETTSPGQIALLDDEGSQVIFQGGADSVTCLVPFIIPIKAYSSAGAWSLTTGANVHCKAVGSFT